jgi:hypothetical protein
VARSYQPGASSPGQLAAQSDPSLVSGGNTLKFYRQPQLAHGLPPALASAGRASRTQMLEPPEAQQQHHHHPGHQHAQAARDAAAAAAAAQAAAAAAQQAASAPASRTVGTQSDYRDSEAQTGPWAPGYVLPAAVSARQAALGRRHNCEEPELLQLEGMEFELVGACGGALGAWAGACRGPCEAHAGF